jgi:hypothetical protein
MCCNPKCKTIILAEKKIDDFDIVRKVKTVNKSRSKGSVDRIE